MDQKYRDLNERFNELQGIYEGRPSRPEDTQLIQKLQEEVLEKEGDLKKAAEDMKFYKLELINREHTFNNMFGNNPNVGLMNPMQAAAKVSTKLPPTNQPNIPRKGQRPAVWSRDIMINLIWRKETDKFQTTLKSKYSIANTKYFSFLA